MRIISGFLKGHKLSFLKNETTRPLKDSVKENIFNIIKHSNLIKIKIESSSILDLYSGTGSFGIECISRGAKKVTFIENNNLSFNILRNNLFKLSIVEKSSLINESIESALDANLNEKFNIFFLDPPFSSNMFVGDLEKINRKKYFARNHLVIIHREKKAFDNLSHLMKIITIKEYGRSKVIFGHFF